MLGVSLDDQSAGPDTTILPMLAARQRADETLVEGIHAEGEMDLAG